MGRFGREQLPSHGHWPLLTIDLVLCDSTRSLDNGPCPQGEQQDTSCLVLLSPWIWMMSEEGVLKHQSLCHRHRLASHRTGGCQLGTPIFMSFVLSLEWKKWAEPTLRTSSVLIAQSQRKERGFADATVLCLLLLVAMVNPQGSSLSRPMVNPWARSLSSSLQTKFQKQWETLCSEACRERA